VSRLSIVIGRTFGGATVALIQGFIIMIIAIALGVQVAGLGGFLLTVLIMVLLSFTAVGFGLILASKMRDFEGFQSIMSLIIMPLMFLSSSFYPINESLPDWLRVLSFCNPLFYMVDGIRGSFTGINSVLDPLVDLGIILVICIVIRGLGTYFFNKSEVQFLYFIDISVNKKSAHKKYCRTLRTQLCQHQKLHLSPSKTTRKRWQQTIASHSCNTQIVCLKTHPIFIYYYFPFEPLFLPFPLFFGFRLPIHFKKRFIY